MNQRQIDILYHRVVFGVINSGFKIRAEQSSLVCKKLDGTVVLVQKYGSTYEAGEAIMDDKVVQEIFTTAAKLCAQSITERRG